MAMKRWQHGSETGPRLHVSRALAGQQNACRGRQCDLNMTHEDERMQQHCFQPIAWCRASGAAEGRARRNDNVALHDSRKDAHRASPT